MTKDEAIKKVMELGGYAFINIEKQKISQRSVWSVTALCLGCGNIRHSVLKDFLRQGCGECAKIKRKKDAEHLWQQRVKQVEHKYNFTCLDIVKTDRVSVHWKCNCCGKIKTKGMGAIWFNKQDLLCSCKHSTNSEIVDIKTNIYRLEKLQKTINDRVDKYTKFIKWYLLNGYKFICCYDKGVVLLHKKCQKEHKVAFADMSQNKYHYGCRACSRCGMSAGVEEIEKYLNEHKIVFEREKTFPTCRYKRKLFFDFYLQEHSVLIEFNGEQHYKPCKIFGGAKKFELTKIRDKIKQEWANEHRIKLITIAWNENIGEVLTNELRGC